MRPLILIAITIITVGCKNSDSSYKTEPETDLRGDSRSGYFVYHKDTNTLFSGTAITYMNGQKKREVNYSEGVEDGLHTVWYENGQKYKEEHYKNGKEDGLYKEWHKNGKKKSEQNYKDGIVIKGSKKYWNSKGESVDTYLEAIKSW